MDNYLAKTDKYLSNCNKKNSIMDNYLAKEYINQLNKYECINCKYYTTSKRDYNRHLLTSKHNKNMNTNSSENISDTIYKCSCGKLYKYQSGYCKHKKKCKYNENINDVSISINNNHENNDENKEEYKDLVMKLIIKNQEIINDNQEIKNIMINSNKENQELRKQITHMIPLIGNNNNTINNNQKQKFNINVFLNEKCKDAISIDQFIDTIEVSMKNLLTTKDNGLGEGLSSIIIDNMNKLSLYERPMHCTDKKRETMYIKNQEWTKDEKLEQINDLLKNVENKQIKNIKQWMDKHPKFLENEKLQEEFAIQLRKKNKSYKRKERHIKEMKQNSHLASMSRVERSKSIKNMT